MVKEDCEYWGLTSERVNPAVHMLAVPLALEAAEGVLGPEFGDGQAPPSTVLQERSGALGHEIKQFGR
eukprot:953923-Pyramimonas_sp.AAC.1